jgi:hypothetical protein
LLLVEGGRQRCERLIQARQRRFGLPGLLTSLRLDRLSCRRDLLALRTFVDGLGSGALTRLQPQRLKFLLDLDQGRLRLRARLGLRTHDDKRFARSRATASRTSARARACGAPASAPQRRRASISSRWTSDFSLTRRATWAWALGISVCASRVSEQLATSCRSVPAQGTSPVSPNRRASSSAFSAARPASRSMAAARCSARRTAPWHCVS